MGSNGNIIKISNGHMQETAKQEYTSFAQTMESNAANKVNEKSADGVVFGEPDKMVTKEDLVDITVGIFFDGTGNNRKNVDSREDVNAENHYKSKGWKALWNDNTSYKNDRTNVDHLEKMYQKQTLYFSIYIEGVGTKNDKYDSLSDMGLGLGGWGLRAKVRSACKSLVTQIQTNTTKSVNTLTIDVFGFSRGAASARNFIHEITKPAYDAHPGQKQGDINLYDDDGELVSQKKMPSRGQLGLEMQQKKLKINFFKTRFAGLFDTVSAFGSDHSNDAKELHLNAINKMGTIVHFTAADEHRKKFELAPISRSDSEFALPGVHADVGGSYVDNTLEEVSLAEEMTSVLNREKLIREERNKLIEQGWYRAGQMTNDQPYKLNGKRTLSNKYSLIPLHLMFEMGEQCHFVKIKMEADLYTIPAVPLPHSKLALTDVYARIRAYVILKTALPLVFNTDRQLQSIRNMVKEGYFPAEKLEALSKDHDMLYELRNKYLHFSSSWDGIGMEPRINSQGERERDNNNKDFKVGL